MGVSTVKRKAFSVLLSLLVVGSMVAPFVVLTSESVSAESSSSDDWVVAATNDYIVKQYADNSTEIWNKSVSDSPYGLDVYPNGDVAYTGPGFSVTRLDGETGAELWTNGSSDSAAKGLAVAESGATFVGTYGSSGEKLHIFGPNGTKIKQVDFPGSVNVIASKENYVFVGDSSGNFTTYDASEPQNPEKLHVYSTPVADGAVDVHNGSLFSAKDDVLYQYSINETGGLSLQDSFQSPDGTDTAKSVTVFNGTAYFGVNNGDLYKVNLTSKSLTSITQISDDWSGLSYSTDYSTLYANDRANEQLQYLDPSDGTQTNTKPLYSFTRGVIGEGEYIDKYSSGGASANLNVTVEDQTANPIDNATVRVAYSDLGSVTEQRANLTDLSNPTPDVFSNWQQRAPSVLSAVEDNSSVDRYPLIYDRADLGLTYQDDADLSSPETLQLTPGEKYALLIGNPDGCGFGEFVNEYNRQVPGCVADSGKVKVERLSPSGEVVSSTQLEVEDTNRRDVPGVTEISYAQFQFQTGYYRVSVAGEENSYSYPVQVGTPLPAFDDALQSQQETLTNYAEKIRNAQTDGTLTVTTAVTNESGVATASVPESAEVVSVSATKAPGVDVEPKNLTAGKVRDAFNSGVAQNASIYYPSKTKRVEPPANVTLTMREIATPRDGNLSRIKDRLQRLENLLFNGSFANLPPVLQDRLENVSRDRLEGIYADLADLVRSNDALRDVYLDKSQFTEVRPGSELSRSALERETVLMHESLTELQNGGDEIPPITIEPPEVDRSDETVTLTWSTPADLSDQNVTAKVFVDYSNGTSRVVNSSYVTTESNLLGNDQIRLVNYPLNETDPAGASFRLRVVGAEGIGGEETPVRNPTFSGTIPGLDAIRLSSLAPGPDDRVTVTTLPEKNGGFDRVSKITAYAPDGTQIDTTDVTDGRQASFTTAGEGTHRVELVIESADGTRFTEVVTVDAKATDDARPPSLYARESVLGSYALVGDGLQSGAVDVRQDDVTLTATLPDDADAPPTVHIYAEGLSLPAQSEGVLDSPDTEIETRIVRGSDRESIQKHVTTYVHLRALSENAIVYRQEDQPLPSEESTQYGRTDLRSNSTTVATYTDADGSVDLSVTNDPGRLTELLFELRTSSVTSFLPLVIAPELPGADLLSV